MKNYKKSVKEVLLAENKVTCFDCGMPNPQWASVTFGVFICLECAGTHRSYGASVSRVKSVNMDDWDEREYTAMKIGGNAELDGFIQKHNLNKKEDMFYKSSLMATYSGKLKAKVSESVKEEPQPESPQKTQQESNQTSPVAPQQPKRKIHYEADAPRRTLTKSASESSLHQALNTTISVVGKSMAKGAKIIKDKTVEYGEKLSENIVKPSIKMLREKKGSFVRKFQGSEIVEVKPEEKPREDTTWSQWD